MDTSISTVVASRFIVADVFLEDIVRAAVAGFFSSRFILDDVFRDEVFRDEVFRVAIAGLLSQGNDDPQHSAKTSLFRTEANRALGAPATVFVAKDGSSGKLAREAIVPSTFDTALVFGELRFGL
jgi:hypothetical protein